jgi:hypothetical protein
MKKKLMTLGLAICLVFSLVVPAGAANVVSGNEAAEVSISEIPTGTMVALQEENQGTYALASSTANRNDGDVLYATSLYDGEILQLSNDTYLGKADGNNYVTMSKIDVDVEDFDRTDPVFEEHNISSEMLDEIQESISFAEENGNDALEISVYSVNDEYVTVNGNQYKNAYTEVRNASFKPLDISGSTTITSLSSSVSFVLTVVGMVSSTVNFVSTGVSLLSYFQSQTGLPVARGTTEDWCYITMSYDKLVKHTSIKKPAGWMEGCISQKLWINKVSMWADFHSTEAGVQEIESSINKVQYTKSWSDCYTIAFNNWTSAIKDGNISMNYKGVTWVFK